MQLERQHWLPGLPTVSRVLLLAACVLGLWSVPKLHAAPAMSRRSPFGISVALKAGPESTSTAVQVDFTLPRDCVLYADKLHFLNEAGDELTPVQIPEPLLRVDKVSRQQKRVYEHSFSAILDGANLPGDRLGVKFQGCTNDACFFPEKRIFALQAGGVFSEVGAGSPSAAVPALADADWSRELGDFKVMGRQTGYLRAAEFKAFLDRALLGGESSDDPLARFKKLGLAATLLLIVAGGFLLNFTPCVLPMIPINLAIIGAGVKARSRTEGFRNGGLYGAGMALAYGTLGLVVVLTGAKFGTLNSSVWFNVVIAVTFILLALGMFDVLNIDFSRFGGRFRANGDATRAGSLAQQLVVLGMGVFAALLAGACVAPVVISVILLATSFYSKGVLAGLLLPFLLGLGMALPWPFAGAGMAFLPKPGRWMQWVKHGFGALIAGFALYYGHIAYHNFHLNRPISSATSLTNAPRGQPDSSATLANEELALALRQARTEERPVFIDFHASWCKSCAAMDETVFTQPAVQERLRDFVVIRYAAEQPNESPAREVLDRFGVIGLPAYVVMATASQSPEKNSHN